MYFDSQLITVNKTFSLYKNSPIGSPGSKFKIYNVQSDVCLHFNKIGTLTVLCRRTKAVRGKTSYKPGPVFQFCLINNCFLIFKTKHFIFINVH